MTTKRPKLELHDNDSDLNTITARCDVDQKSSCGDTSGTCSTKHATHLIKARQKAREKKAAREIIKCKIQQSGTPTANQFRTTLRGILKEKDAHKHVSNLADLDTFTIEVDPKEIHLSDDFLRFVSRMRSTDNTLKKQLPDVFIQCDGSYGKNSSHIGMGVTVFTKEKTLLLMSRHSESIRTSCRAELYALLCAINYVNTMSKTCNVWITTDSSYAFGCMDSFVEKWINTDYGMMTYQLSAKKNLDILFGMYETFKKIRQKAVLDGFNVVLFNVKREFSAVSDMLANFARL